jgi:isocitrate/isopropylmalate dehydrogenase
MLETLGHKDAAADIERAVIDVLRAGKHKTADIGGKTSTSKVGDAVAAQLSRT